MTTDYDLVSAPSHHARNSACSVGSSVGWELSSQNINKSNPIFSVNTGPRLAGNKVYELLANSHLSAITGEMRNVKTQSVRQTVSQCKVLQTDQTSKSEQKP